MEIIGMIGSLLVAVSLMMSSLVRLRVINLAGSLIFACYGFAIGSFPVFVLNLFIVFSNSFYLYRMRKRNEYFNIVAVASDSEYLLSFLRFYRSDISRFSPKFSFELGHNDNIFFVLRDVVPAGVLIGTMDGDTFAVRLDYVTPQYRDMKTGKFIYYDSVDYFKNIGITSFTALPGSPSQQKYLERIGFIVDDGAYLFRIAEQQESCGKGNDNTESL